MDGSQFDAWTRRRVGLATGGLAAALLGLVQLEGAGAKKCKTLKAACNPKAKNKKKKCCGNLKCGESVAIPEGTHCCRKAPGKCTDATECCAPALCNVGAGKCCFLDNEGPCKTSEDCCSDATTCNPETKKCETIV
jgi:hypothetical protein